MVRRPQIDVDRVENSEKRETPRDPFNDRAMTVLCELVDDGAKQQKVDDGPAESLTRLLLGSLRILTR